MWLTVLIVIAFVAGLAIAVFGGGPIGFVLVAIAILGLALRFLGGLGAQSGGEKQDPNQPLGPAHEGQAHMTPEQI
jgi:membrane protein implicated in regulation of membrane protease activity